MSIKGFWRLFDVGILFYRVGYIVERNYLRLVVESGLGFRIFVRVYCGFYFIVLVY